MPPPPHDAGATAGQEGKGTNQDTKKQKSNRFFICPYEHGLISSNPDAHLHVEFHNCNKSKKHMEIFMGSVCQYEIQKYQITKTYQNH